ncbi:diguanylate cyclase [Liberiplasma polymorphum]|uniref:GGDEF domain-containing protein n=1 Tax=Liberiplasma polymorphum TaxID=3374570 RepID=UPI0037766B16
MEFKYNENLIPYLYEGVYVVDKKRKIIFWNEGSERITGYTSDEVTNSFCYHNILQHIDETGKQLCFNGCPLQKTLKDGVINEARVYLKHKDGYRVPVMVKSLPIYDEKQNIVAAIEVFTDERFQKQIYHENQELKDKLRIDPLTQIANRHFFDFQLSKKLEEAKMFANPFGILVIDIDHFKQVNDTYGHLVGDEILKIVAKSLTSNTEKTDLVSRWGGEEFIVILDVTSTDDLLKVAERLRLVVAASSYQFENGKTIQVTISLGGTLAKPGDSAKTLIARADDNMYFAKQNGRNQSKVL